METINWEVLYLPSHGEIVFKEKIQRAAETWVCYAFEFGSLNPWFKLAPTSYKWCQILKDAWAHTNNYFYFFNLTAHFQAQISADLITFLMAQMLEVEQE